MEIRNQMKLLNEFIALTLTSLGLSFLTVFLLGITGWNTEAKTTESKINTIFLHSEK